MSTTSWHGDCKIPAIVLVTGGTGLVGKSIQKVVSDSTKGSQAAESCWVFQSSKNVDLRDINATFEYFQRVKPTHVLHLAAVFGGLFRNMR